MTEFSTPTVKRHALRLISLIEHAGLLIVLAATIVAAAQEILAMFDNRRVGVTDLLLLFIYLEIVTMSAVYWRAGRLPVRMPLYIAMVAMARHMMLETQAFDALSAIAQAFAILLLAVAVLVVRYGHIRMPYTDEGGGSNRLS
ncbi:MAG: phosphate-starvation-inducible PsiE family protein [Proteobacteria bacterium]|nr:phosphate-starvation-inducible PsiE family protein [Pseudomonadota bacterium]